MSFFHDQFDHLREHVLQMAEHAQHSVANAFDAFLNKDAALARQVQASDACIKAIEMAIDDESLRLLALDQPLARDLRCIVGCMRLVIDFKDVCDEADSVAEHTVVMSAMASQPVSPAMAQLASMVHDMFANALTAIRTGDAELAEQVCRREADAKSLYFHVVKISMDAGNDNAAVERAIHRLMVAKSMERIACQSANIAETAFFIVKGTHP